MRKYACLFIEDWICPIFKRLNTSEDEIKNVEAEALKILALFCQVCPHIKKK